MPVEKLWSTYKATADFDTFTADEHEIFYEPSTGDLRLDDGVTPGGIPLTFSEIRFNTTHVTTGNEPAGSLSWSTSDQTLELVHPGGVVQQMGQETYGYVRNNTGTLIPNGTAVRFAGAEQNGQARLEVAPFQANNVFPTLYAFGIATQDIPDGEDGRVTVWGKVRGLDTTGQGGETWAVGDILFVSPTTAGGLTKIRPTAPNNVIPMAAVLSVDSENGEIFVRVSFEQQKNYGEFGNNSNVAATIIDTATSIPFTTTSASQQITRKVGDNTTLVFAEAGFYSFALNCQLLSSNASTKTITFWFVKNGTNIANSARLTSVTTNSAYRSFSCTETFSVSAGDEIQVKFAVTDLTLQMVAVPANAYAPAASSVQLVITQPAL